MNPNEYLEVLCFHLSHSTYLMKSWILFTNFNVASYINWNYSAHNLVANPSSLHSSSNDKKLTCLISLWIQVHSSWIPPIGDLWRTWRATGSKENLWASTSYLYEIWSGKKLLYIQYPGQNCTILEILNFRNCTISESINWKNLLQFIIRCKWSHYKKKVCEMRELDQIIWMRNFLFW